MLESIGHYRIRRKIGQGAMGVVYEGWDDRLQRSVAVKTIHQANESALARERLWREARSMARINHPHVCQVYDVIEDGGSLVLVLELLEGQPLSERLLGGGMNAMDTLGIVRQMLHALAALHDLGIVHRDLKPSNVFLTRHGVKLLDFGLAKSSEGFLPADASPAGTAATLSSPGSITGTACYMSPEQASGQPAGATADLFSVGIVFYEMLTGRRPFDGASIVDVLYAVMHKTPPPLSGSREIEALDMVIRKAMAKRSMDRYASADEMLAALETISFIATGALAQPARVVTRMIVLPFRTLKSDDETDFLAFALPEAISHSLTAMNNLIVRSSLLGARFKDRPDPRQVAVEADVDAFLTGSLLRAEDRFRLTCQLVEAPGGTVLWSQSANSSMQDLFTIQDEMCDRILKSLQLPLDEREGRGPRRDIPATARAYECYLRANQISLSRTPENMWIARDLYLQCLEESPDYAPAWARMGRAYHFLDKFDAVGGHKERSTEAFNRAFSLNPDLAIAHNWSTPAECDQGNAKRAMVRLLERARVRRNDADLLAGLVQACRYCDELDASVAAHNRGRHLDPNLTTSVAHTHFLLGDYRRTIDCYDRDGVYYLDCAALVALGEDQTALARLRERELRSSGLGLLKGLMGSLRAYLEGDWEASFDAIVKTSSADPEALYYVARHFARLDKPDHAISALSVALDGGFLCATALTRDPWFEPIRSLPRFVDLARRAEGMRTAIHDAFVSAGGEQVIGVA